jgi:hypothetical protein
MRRLRTLAFLIVAAALWASAPAQASWGPIDYAQGGYGALTGTVTFAYSQPAAGSCPSVWWRPAPLELSLHESATAQMVVNYLQGRYVGPVTITVDGTQQCFYETEWVPSTVTISGTDRLGDTFACSGLSGVWFLFDGSGDYSVTTGGGTCSLNGVALPGTASTYETGAFIQTAGSGNAPTSGNVTGALSVYVSSG